jgi:hypothetical protein
MLTVETLKIGGHYNWKNQPQRLIYTGMCEPRNGRWHQFEKVGEPGVVWCEVLTADLHMLEETPPASGVAPSAPALQWRGLTKDEIDHAVGELVEYGTDFVAPLYSVVEGIERKLRERNAGVPGTRPSREWYGQMIDDTQQAEDAAGGVLAAGGSLEPLPPNLGCKLPPPGWWCSREPGHDGPCAARPTDGVTEDGNG